MGCICLLILTGCTKSREFTLKDFLKQQYLSEYAEVYEVQELLDSVYDPHDELMKLYEQVGDMQSKPDVKAILSEEGHEKNAMGRRARIKNLNTIENIIVYYDSDGNIKYTSLQNKQLARRTLSKYFVTKSFFLNFGHFWPLVTQISPKLVTQMVTQTSKHVQLLPFFCLLPSFCSLAG